MTEQTADATPADVAREHLATIRKGWRHVLDPIETTTTSSGSRGDTIRPATEDEADEQLPPDARFDTPRVLAFWVHAALEQWPTILQTLQPGADGKLRLETTETIDCGDLYAMVDLLDREAGRITGWVDGDRDFGATFVGDLTKLAKAVARVAWPPKGDRITIGDCPACGRRVRVKAPTWLLLPQPTTDPHAYAEWEWMPDRAGDITCRCGISDTLEGWHGRMVPFEEREPMTADQLVVVIRQELGMKYEPAVLRQWSRRGMISTRGYSEKGHALYDRTQVLAALLDRERRRAVAS